MNLKQKIKSFRKSLKAKLRSRIKGNIKDNTIIKPKNGVFRLEVKGKNNKIIFPPTVAPDSVIEINICGDNNVIKIDSCERLVIKIKIGDSGSKTNNCTFSMGEYSHTWGTSVFMMENDSQIIIGHHSMFSWNTVMWCTDMHTITDLNGVPQNQGKSIIIGDYVWGGKDVHIAKNVVIPSYSIIGWCSNITRKFSEEHTVIAGNPATVVKHNVNWHGSRYDEYIKKNPVSAS